MNAPVPLFVLPENIESRWASPENPDGLKGEAARSNKGRKGRACFPLKAGEQVVLAHASGQSGMVRRIWATISERSPVILRGLRIDIYWDGAETPAVSAPFGDFFSQGLGRCQTFESVFFSNPEGRSFNSVLSMPFLAGFRIVLSNESPADIGMVFYDVNYTLGDRFEKPAYLHAHWRREAPTTLARDFAVLPKVSGRGRFLGANFSVIVNTKTYFDSWWGEGECKVYLDGDTEHPTLAGTGTEDYIGSAWGQGQYSNLYQGCHLQDGPNAQYAFYRYHVPDPIYFHRDIRVDFQQIGWSSASCLHKMRDAGLHLLSVRPAGEQVDMNLPREGGTLFERQDDWASCCYFYLDRPESGLTPLAPASGRMSGLLSSPTVSITGVA